MLYMLRNASAEDDGTAWRYESRPNGQQTRVQTGPLSVTLLDDGRRVVGVGSEILIDDELALMIRRFFPAPAEVFRPARIRGPQPELAQRPAMLQLQGLVEVTLARRSVECDEAGNVLRTIPPYVLDARERPPEPLICKIRENGVTLVSTAIRDVLAKEPTADFVSVPFEGDPRVEELARPVKVEAAPDPVAFWEATLAREQSRPAAERDPNREAHMRSRLEAARALKSG